MKTIRIADTTRQQRAALAAKMRVALGTLDHIASGLRKASAEMAGKIEKASTEVLGVAITRESLCSACKKCELAKTARKSQQVDEGKIW